MIAHVRSQRRELIQPGATRSQSGESLIETLLTVLILSMVVVGMLGAIWTLTRVSDTGNRSSRAMVEATSWAERYLEFDYIDCASVTSPSVNAYRTAHSTGMPTLPTGYDATLAIRYLSSSGSPLASPPASGSVVPTLQFGSTCTSDLGVQELTVTVTSDRGTSRELSRSVVILKRKALCPTPTLPGYSGVTKC